MITLLAMRSARCVVRADRSILNGRARATKELTGKFRTNNPRTMKAALKDQAMNSMSTFSTGKSGTSDGSKDLTPRERLDATSQIGSAMDPLQLVQLPRLMSRSQGRSELAVALIEGPVAYSQKTGTS
jgi:hypothetical protein